MIRQTIYSSNTEKHEVDVDVSGEEVVLYEAEVGAISYADFVSLSRDEAIAVAKAILAHYGECSE